MFKPEGISSRFISTAGESWFIFFSSNVLFLPAQLSQLLKRLETCQHATGIETAFIQSYELRLSFSGSDKSSPWSKESLSFSQLSGPTHLISKSLRFSASEWSMCVQMELLNSIHSARLSDSNDSKAWFSWVSDLYQHKSGKKKDLVYCCMLIHEHNPLIDFSFQSFKKIFDPVKKANRCRLSFQRWFGIFLFFPPVWKERSNRPRADSP